MRPAGPFSVHEAARDSGHAPAVICGDEIWTFEELAARVGGTQRRLRALGLAIGTRVGWVARLDLESLVAMSALIEEGLVPCLLHPRLPASVHTGLLRKVSAEPLDPQALVSAPAPEPPPRGPRDRESDFVILFSSGTSSEPKGVRLARRAFEASVEASDRNLGVLPSDRWLLNLPLAHIGGFSIVLRARRARLPVILPEAGAAQGFDPQAFVGRLEAHRVTLASMVPTMLARVVADRLPAPSSVRAVLLGGAAAGIELRSAARRWAWPILTTYGLTEACSQVSTQSPRSPRVSGLDVGCPLHGWEVRIVDGRIYIRGSALMSGYLPADSGVSEDGWLDTGDIGRWDTRGCLQIDGRADERVITGGENVAPARVEAALRDCPGVKDAVVYGLPDPEWGETVAAALVGDGGPRPSSASLTRALEGRLAGFERPRTIRWVSEFPLLPSGKIDRRRVRADAEGAANAESGGEMH